MLEKKVVDDSTGPSHEDGANEDHGIQYPGNSCSGGEKISSSSSTTSHHSSISSFQPPIKNSYVKSFTEKPCLLELGPSSSSCRSRIKSSPHTNSSDDVIGEENEEDLGSYQETQSRRNNEHYNSNLSESEQRSPDTDPKQAFHCNYFNPFPDESEDDGPIIPLPSNDIPIIPGIVLSPSDVDSAFEESRSEEKLLAQQEQQHQKGKSKKKVKLQRKSFTSLESDEDDEKGSSSPLESSNGFRLGSIPCQPRRRIHTHSGALHSKKKPKGRKTCQSESLSPHETTNHEYQLLMDKTKGTLSSKPTAALLLNGREMKEEAMLFNLELTPQKVKAFFFLILSSSPHKTH